MPMDYFFVLTALFDNFQYGMGLDLFPGAQYFDSSLVHENDAIAEREELSLMRHNQPCRVLHQTIRSDAPVAGDDACCCIRRSLTCRTEFWQLVGPRR